MTGRIEKVISVGRDLVLFVFGLVGISFQQVTGNVNFVLLAIFTAMTGMPGLAHLIVLSRGLRTELPPPSSALPESSVESGNS